MRTVVFAFQDLESKINTIHEYTNLYDANYKYYEKRGWRLLYKIAQAPLTNIDSQNLQILVSEVVKLTGVCYSRIKANDSFYVRKKKIKKLKKCENIFASILTKIENSGTHIGYYNLIDVFDFYSFWKYERFCVDMTEIYIKVTGKNQHVIEEVFMNIEDSMDDPYVKQKMTSLMEIFSSLFTVKDFWPGGNRKLVIKYLNLFIKAVKVDSYLCNIMELTIRNIYSVCTPEVLLYAVEHSLDHYTNLDLPQDQLFKIERSVIIATTWYSSNESLWTVFKQDTLRNIFSLIASTTPHKSSFGNQIFQTMLDSRNNKKNLNYPRIFYYRNYYNINNKHIEEFDKEFVEQYRKEIHLTLLMAFKNHHENITIIIHLYTTICLIIMEVLCDYTIAMIVCLLMNVQKYVLNDQSISPFASHRIHAIIISIMSLICWLTQATMLTLYLEKILQQRAYNAPFLNPPLKDNYQYTNHYILWNRPDLFFETYEVRYALWKRFKLGEMYLADPTTCSDKPKIKKRRKFIPNYDNIKQQQHKRTLKRK